MSKDKIDKIKEALKAFIKINEKASMKAIGTTELIHKAKQALRDLEELREEVQTPKKDRQKNYCKCNIDNHKYYGIVDNICQCCGYALTPTN